MQNPWTQVPENIHPPKAVMECGQATCLFQELLAHYQRNNDFWQDPELDASRVLRFVAELAIDSGMACHFHALSNGIFEARGCAAIRLDVQVELPSECCRHHIFLCPVSASAI